SRSDPMRPRPPLLALTAVAAVATALTVTTAAATRHAGADPARHPGTGWLGTWAATPSGKVDNGCADCTIRDVVHTSIGGYALRVHLSNVFGTAPLRVAHTTVAIPAVPDTAQVRPGTLRDVTFQGKTDVTIPAGQAVTSDPLGYTVPGDH